MAARSVLSGALTARPAARSPAARSASRLPRRCASGFAVAEAVRLGQAALAVLLRGEVRWRPPSAERARSRPSPQPVPEVRVAPLLR
eukprot:7989920-Lingulodinium_polyedra.AAC.1